MLVLLLAPTAQAVAQSHHGRHHAFYQNWINKADKGCCNDQDCGELAENDERTIGDRVEVLVEGTTWCPVEPHHYLKRGNAPNWATAHVCVRKWRQPDEPACARLLCYQPKPGT